MILLSDGEINSIAAGTSNVWYNMGHTMGGWYAEAIDKTTDLFVWVDELDGSLAD